MKRSKRWTVAVVSLGLGVVIGLVSNDRLIGQPALGPALVMPRELPSYAPVVKRVLPALVSLEGKTKGAPAGQGRQTQGGGAQPGQPPLPDIDPGFGSGVIVDPSGVILTNNHVVVDTDSVDITLADGRK